MSSRAGSARAAPRPRGPAPPGIASQYEAGASLQRLARRYRMSAKTVRAHLVAAGVQIRPPGRLRRTAHPTAPTAASTTAVTAEQRPALATVHPLRPRPSSQHEDPEPEPPWPSFDLDDLVPPRRPRVARDSEGRRAVYRLHHPADRAQDQRDPGSDSIR